jgi:hypothetical protein
LAEKATEEPLTVALAAGAVTLVVGCAVLSTVTLVTGEVVTFPASSVARAVSECEAFVSGVVFHVIEYGAVVSVVFTAPSTRKSTFVTRLSSLAAAVTVCALPLTTSLGAGEAIASVGPAA